MANRFHCLLVADRAAHDSALFLLLLCPSYWRKEQSEMQLIITGKNMEVSEPLKKYVEAKLGKLARYLPHD